jgi:hemoglobin
VVSEFYDRVLESDVIAHHFEHVDVARLIEHQSRFISFLMGGPASYSDDHIERVHQRLAITLPEFQEMVSLLRETLEDFDLSSEDIGVVERQLRRREALIVSAH